MRTLHTARPVSRQGTIVFDPRAPATPRVPLRCVLYYDAKIRFRSTKTLCRAGSGVAHSGGLCTLDTVYRYRLTIPYIDVEFETGRLTTHYPDITTGTGRLGTTFIILVDDETRDQDERNDYIEE